MDPISKRLQDHYSAKFSQHGANSQGVDWGTDQARVVLRYDKMLALLEDGPGKPSVLDVGCGYGGLLGHAQSKAIALDYSGIDVAEAMVEAAKRKYPGTRFLVGDVLDLNAASQKFDYVICNGILTQKLDVPGLAMDEFAGRIIRHMFALCTRGLAFNIMTSKVNFFENNLYYRNPAEMLAWAMTEITPRVKIDHSYPLYEYSMYLYKG
jgi:SAM-dependent methyltransferase